MCSLFDVIFFCFQAEDGIRDLVRSRGLGDVYKRQSCDLLRQVAVRPRGGPVHEASALEAVGRVEPARDAAPKDPVSYTHLTLPTSDLV